MGIAVDSKTGRKAAVGLRRILGYISVIFPLWLHAISGSLGGAED
jgi:hypothetical protein